MVDKTCKSSRVTLRLPLCALLGALIIFATGPRDLSVTLYVLLCVPIVSILLLNDAIRGKCLQSLLALVVFWVISAALVTNLTAIRTAPRWLVWSHRYKAEVLAQPATADGELKHIEWDDWGMFAQNTVVYLVFDPSDLLSTAAMSHKPGKFNGIPCEVPPVHRLERNWYVVQFYASEGWGDCN
jgi:hypothetical protein